MREYAQCLAKITFNKKIERKIERKKEEKMHTENILLDWFIKTAECIYWFMSLLVIKCMNCYMIHSSNFIIHT